MYGLSIPALQEKIGERPQQIFHLDTEIFFCKLGVSDPPHGFGLPMKSVQIAASAATWPRRGSRDRIHRDGFPHVLRARSSREERSPPTNASSSLRLMRFCAYSPSRMNSAAEARRASLSLAPKPSLLGGFESRS